MGRIYHNGRTYKVLATFPDNPTGHAEANAYMETHAGASLLLTRDGTLYLADENDNGNPIMGARFSVEQEMDDEPTYITDNATDPDDEEHAIITIGVNYGTPQLRNRLAKKIQALLEEIARNGDEVRIADFKTELPE